MKEGHPGSARTSEALARTEPSSSSAARCAWEQDMIRLRALLQQCACHAIRTRHHSTPCPSPPLRAHMPGHAHPRHLSTPQSRMKQFATPLCGFKTWLSTPAYPILTIAGLGSLHVCNPKQRRLALNNQQAAFQTHHRFRRHGVRKVCSLQERSVGDRTCELVD